jgi:hypothetical protein
MADALLGLPGLAAEHSNICESAGLYLPRFWGRRSTANSGMRG